MDTASSIVADLAVIMIVAAIVVYLFYALKQPMILGYLIAGVIIGPYTPPFSFISQTEVFSATADLGIILLLFAIGLRFPISRLRTVGRVSLGVAGIEITFMLLLSFGISTLLDWPFVDALFLGTALASSSTTIIARVLSDMGKMQETSTLIMMGILVVEDLVVVVILAILTSTIGTDMATIDNIWLLAVKALGFIGGSMAIGLLVIPRIINRINNLGNNEVLLLVVLGLVFGLSIASNVLGFSFAIGAFLMGVIIGNARCVDCVSALIVPIRDMFAAIFFVSMGALIDVTQFQYYILPALLITALMIFGKVVGCGVGTRAFGYSTSTSIKVGLGMSQIGEFAFIVMKTGQDLNLISSFLFPVVGVAAAITTFLTPYLMKLSFRIDLDRLRRKEEV